MRRWSGQSVRAVDAREIEHAAMLRSNGSIIAALANGPQDEHCLLLGAGTWNITGTITISKSNVTIRGLGPETKLQLQRGVNAALLVVTGDNVTIENISFLTESGTGVSPEYAISVTGDNCTIRDCTFNGFYRTIIATNNLRMMLANNRFKNSGAGCIDLNNTDYSVVSGNIIETNAAGNEIDLDASCQYNSIFGNVAVGGALYMPSATAHAANNPAATTF